MAEKKKKKRVHALLDEHALAHLPKSAYEIVGGDGLGYLYKPQDIINLEKRLFDFFTLSQLGKSLISTKDLEDIGRVLVACVYESSGAKNVALMVNSKEPAKFNYQYSIGLEADDVKDIYFENKEGLFWQVLNGGEPFPIQDSSGQYRFGPIVEQYKLGLLESQIWVPLMVKNSLRGVLTLGDKKDGSKYSRNELGFISQLAAQASVAIDSAMLNLQKSKATEALGKKMQNLSVLYDVSKAISFTNDLKNTLLVILDKSREVINAQKGSIMLMNKETGLLEIRVVRGLDALTERRINDGEIECKKIKSGEGVAGQVFETCKPVIVTDAAKDARFHQSASSNVDNIVCLPLLADDQCIGVMNITNKIGGGAFTEDEISLLATLAGQVAVTINNANLYHLAITDGLTQLYINRYFQQKLREELSRCKRYGRAVSLIMSDIDFFKKFNDSYGHQQGDSVLATTSKIFRQCIREHDLPCRYGGEEFALVLPETDADAAMIVAERIRKMTEEYEFPSLKAGGDSLKVTLSLGIATFPKDAELAEDLIKKADDALYACKEAGRNCCRAAT